MNNDEIATLTKAIIRDSQSLDETYAGIVSVGKASAGQTMIKIGTGQDVVIHKKEATMSILEAQRDSLIDSIRSDLDKLDNRQRSV